MTQEEMKDLMIDYIDGKLTGELREFVIKQIQKDPENQKYYEELKASIALLEADRELEPDSTMKMSFEAALQEEQLKIDQGEAPAQKSRRFIPWQMAASVALLVSVGFIALLLMKNHRDDQEIAALKKEMEMTRQLVLQSLEDQSSASRRLNAVNTAYAVDRPDKELINALIRTMNSDDNTNVRLAAVEALVKFAGDPDVKRALITSLENQSDPMVQITLIQVMVQLNEQKAVDELRKIIEDKSTIEAVKDEAHMAVFKLS